MPAVALRRAVPQDAELLWRWRNDQGTRRASFSTAHVPWDTHLDWFTRSLASDARTLLVAEVDSAAVGLLRFDRVSSEEWEISVNLAPEARGRGLASPVIEAGVAELARMAAPRLVLARVRPDNLRSLRSFASAGFTEAARDDSEVLLTIVLSGAGE